MDRYPEIGPRGSCPSPEKVIDLVRAVWPSAYVEGSTGAERTWWVAVDGETELVAHQWPVVQRRPLGRTWVRIRTP